MPIEYVISSWRENRSSKTRVIISRHCDHLNCTFFHNHAVFPMRMRQSVCGQTYWNLNDLRRTDLLWWIRVTVRVTLDAGAIFVIVQDVACAKRQTAAAYRYREYLNPSSDNKNPAGRDSLFFFIAIILLLLPFKAALSAGPFPIRLFLGARIVAERTCSRFVGYFHYSFCYTESGFPGKFIF